METASHFDVISADRLSTRIPVLDLNKVRRVDGAPVEGNSETMVSLEGFALNRGK